MKRILLLFFIFIINSCVSVKVSDNSISETTIKESTPKNIILLIGDGMGLSQVSIAQYYQDTPSNFDRFPVIGLSKTSSATHVITESAAGATAISCGIKAANKTMGIDENFYPVETIVEYVSKMGLSTGLVVTSSIVGATPASFYAHMKSRYDYEEVATLLPQSDIDFFAGGGLQFFNDRKDKKNLLIELEMSGFQVDTMKLPVEVSEKKHAIILGKDGMPKMSEGRGNFLSDATTLAIEKLSANKEGFFLMVEGSQIDWGCHDMDVDYLIDEQLDFDRTIGVAIDYAEKYGETLVIVTADHETGGFALAMDNNDYNKIKPILYSDDHSATMVPVFAYGLGAELFGGVYENTEIFHKMRSLIIE